VVDQGTIHFLVTAKGLPPTAALDHTSLSVTVDGTPVTATIDSSTSSAAPGPRRVAMLVVDTSGSMAGAPLAAAKQAANTFLSRVPADVKVGVVSFADTARLAVPPTTDRARVRSDIAALAAVGSTTLYDAMRLALTQLGPGGERLLVVLSDGADTSSRTTLAAVTALVRQSGATTTLVGYRTDTAQTATLGRLAADVGGRLIPTTGAAGLVSAFGTAAGTFANEVEVTATLPGGLADGPHEVSTSLAFGEQTLTATTTFIGSTVVAAPSAAPVAPTAAASLGLWTSRWLLPLTLLVFVALLLLGLALLTPGPETSSAKSLRAIDGYRLGDGSRNTHAAAPGTGTVRQRTLAQSALGIADAYLRRRNLAESMALQLDRAEIGLRPSEWVLLRVALGGVAAVGLAVLIGNVTVGVAAGTVIAWLGTRLFLSIKAGRRTKSFEQQLPDTLQLMASSLQTGFSLPQAVSAASEIGGQPMAGELGRALAEARLGAPLEDGLDRVADRMDCQDLRWTVMAIRIQRQVGGNLAEVLGTTSRTMRERAALRRHVRALAAEGRLSAYILVALPLGLFGLLFMTRRAYLSLLWTTPLGLVLLGIGVLGMGVGSLWMRKLIDVEV
ncbi:MAG: VWA domain-containing protein, partial [Actinomycetes bacterium]